VGNDVRDGINGTRLEAPCVCGFGFIANSGVGELEKARDNLQTSNLTGHQTLR